MRELIANERENKKNNIAYIIYNIALQIKILFITLFLMGEMNIASMMTS